MDFKLVLNSFLNWQQTDLSFKCWLHKSKVFSVAQRSSHSIQHIVQVDKVAPQFRIIVQVLAEIESD